MSEKKYLLTESDIRQIKDLECGWCADNAGGHFNCADASNAEQERFLEAHEYRERTCEMIDLKTGDRADYDCDEHVFHCEACHAERGVYAYNEDGDVWAEMSKYCPECRAKVVKP